MCAIHFLIVPVSHRLSYLHHHVGSGGVCTLCRQLLHILCRDVEGPGVLVFADVPPVLIGLGDQDVALVGLDGHQAAVLGRVLELVLHRHQLHAPGQPLCYGARIMELQIRGNVKELWLSHCALKHTSTSVGSCYLFMPLIYVFTEAGQDDDGNREDVILFCGNIVCLCCCSASALCPFYVVYVNNVGHLVSVFLYIK